MQMQVALTGTKGLGRPTLHMSHLLSLQPDCTKQQVEQGKNNFKQNSSDLKSPKLDTTMSQREQNN
eukprot:2484769-Amphidinium_carterae.1